MSKIRTDDCKTPCKQPKRFPDPMREERDKHNAEVEAKRQEKLDARRYRRELRALLKQGGE